MLCKSQMLLENEHDTHASARQKRVQAEELAKQVEQLHSATEADLKLHMEKGRNRTSVFIESLFSWIF